MVKVKLHGQSRACGPKWKRKIISPTVAVFNLQLFKYRCIIKMLEVRDIILSRLLNS